MDIVYVYTRPRANFGRPLAFTQTTSLTLNIAPNSQHYAHYKVRTPQTSASQIGPDLAEHEVNTTSRSFAEKGVRHSEGGWPKDVDYNDAEHTIRYRKKVEKDEEYIQAVGALGEVKLDGRLPNRAKALGIRL